MSLIDDIVAVPAFAEPAPNEDADSVELVRMLVAAANKMAVAGVRSVPWVTSVGTWLVEITDDGWVGTVAPNDDRCIWRPGEELTLVVRAQVKVDAVSGAIVAMRQLTEEG